jgi:Skp family chaperone for outer membrane proteins
MRSIIFAATICVTLSLSVIAQTPAPPKRPGINPSASNSMPGITSGKVAVLDTDQFWQGIGEFKIKLDGVKIELEPKRKELVVLEEEIKLLKTKFNSNNPPATPQIRLEWEEQVAEKEKLFKRKTEDFNHFGDKRLAEVSRPVFEKVRKFIESYCQQNGIILCIERNAAAQAGFLLWSANAIDITSDFIAQYNKAYPTLRSPSQDSKNN